MRCCRPSLKGTNDEPDYLGHVLVLVAGVEVIPGIYTHLAAAAVAALAALAYQANRYEAEILTIRAEHHDAIKASIAQARATEQAIARKYQGAINDAKNRETTLRRAADSARAESDSLRDQAATAARRIAAATAPAVAEYATAAAELLGACSRDYQDMASKADGHAADVRMMQSAWPAAQ